MEPGSREPKLCASARAGLEGQEGGPRHAAGAQISHSETLVTPQPRLHLPVDWGDRRSSRTFLNRTIFNRERTVHSMWFFNPCPTTHNSFM